MPDSTSDTLVYLVKRSRLGDMGSFTRIVKRFQDMAYGYAYSLIGDSHLAEDAAQEAFIEAYSQLPKLREPKAFPGWMRFIVQKHCDRITRKRKMTTLPLDPEGGPSDPGDGPSQKVVREETRRQIIDAVNMLPQGQRTVTTLHYINGYSQNEIAAFLQINPSTVRKRLFDSRKKLKQALKTEDIMEKENTIRELFKNNVSSGLMKQIMQNPAMVKLRGEKREVTVLFSDIRNFTNTTESMDPEDVIAWMNEYFGVMTKIVQKYDGMVDKFVADELMAFWGSPVYFDDHARKACQAALEMQEEMDRLSKKFIAEGKPEVRAGMGINTGEAIVGNFGTVEKIDYTVMGKTINLGATLERRTKEYGVRILISENTLRQAGAGIKVRELDTLDIKGTTGPVAVYELLASE